MPCRLAKHSPPPGPRQLGGGRGAGLGMCLDCLNLGTSGLSLRIASSASRWYAGSASCSPCVRSRRLPSGCIFAAIVDMLARRCSAAALASTGTAGCSGALDAARPRHATGDASKMGLDEDAPAVKGESCGWRAAGISGLSAAIAAATAGEPCVTRSSRIASASASGSGASVAKGADIGDDGGLGGLPVAPHVACGALTNRRITRKRKMT